MGGGGGGHGGGGGLGGHAAAASARGATMEGRGTTLANHGAARANTMYADHAISSKHAASEHPASRLAGTEHHHHHPFRREPQFEEDTNWAYFPCVQEADPSQPWRNCNGPTKSRAGKQRS